MIMSNLSDISFCDTSTTNIETDIINVYEALTSKKLYPGDPIRIFLESIASIIVQQRVIIDFTGKQNLLAYAQGEYLEHLVALVGVTRLEAAPSRCTVKFKLSNAQSGVVTIPKGTRIKAGNMYFSTVEDFYINPGEMAANVIVECMDKGTLGNGLLPGQINTLVDEFPYFSSAENITPTTGGADIETDDALRQRAFEAPSSYSCAGSDGAYAFWAKSVSPEIGDVCVVTPAPGEVNIIPISKGGEILSEELKSKILNVCSAKNIKPLTDKVSVVNPSIKDYSINLQYWIDGKDAPVSSTIQERVEKAVNDYIGWQQGKLGRDINPSELTYRVMMAGAKRVNIISPVFEKNIQTCIAKPSEKKIVYGGVESE